MSYPGPYFKSGNDVTPQLLLMISALWSPLYFHVPFSRSNPDEYSQPNNESPAQSALTGIILAPGAMPTSPYFVPLA